MALSITILTVQPVKHTIFGKEEADRIVNDANLKRLSIRRQDKEVKEVRDKIEHDN